MRKRKHRFILTILIVNYACLLFQVDGQRKCDLNDGKIVCCTHSSGNPATGCKECDIGYTSNNGSDCFECPRPYYGFHCAHKCSCYGDQICDHKIGCKIKNEKESPSEREHNGVTSHRLPQVSERPSCYVSGVKRKMARDMSITETWPMILSSSIAALSLLSVIVIVTVKCKSQMFKIKSALAALCQHNKDKTGERKINPYGSYHLQRLGTDDDEYEFDSDNDEDQDTYAVIRDSHVLQQTIDIDKIQETDVNCDQFEKYNTCDYNHLHIMGLPRPPGFQKKIKGSYSRAVYGTKFSTFQDDQV